MSEASESGTLLVPVANPETTDRLLDTAIDIASERSMDVVVTHVVEVPPQVPLSSGEAVLSEEGTEEQLLEYASELAADAGLDVESRMRYARDTATGIVGAVDAYGADAMLAGWRGRPRRRDVILGSFLDRILGEAPCDVFVKRIRLPTEEIDSVLVPVAGGPHDELATELGGTIAAANDASVHLLRVIAPDATDSTREEATALLESREALLGDEVAVESTVVETDHVAGRITDETAHHDLTVLGATRDPFLDRKLVGSIAESVGRSAASPVVVARRYVERDE